MKKLIALLLCSILLLSACQRQAPGKGKIIRFDLPAPITNLDPQFATDAYSRMIISNIYEGLMTYNENGQLVLGAAKSVETSADKKTLLFKLRENTVWKDGKPLTAHDFVFAFQRMFAPGSPSPFAKDYIAIAYAEKVMESTAPPSVLGVVAKSDYELEITLEHPSPFFPSLLAETPAMPCNREAFDEARGRYGLEVELVSSNGPFYLNRWDNEATIRLMPNPNYSSETPASAGGVYLRVAPEKTRLERLLDGDADITEISYQEAEKVKAQGYTTVEFQDTVWCVVFNQNSEIWGNPLLRQGFAHTVDRRLLQDNLSQNLTLASFLVPPANMLANEKYRATAKASQVAFDPENGKRLFEMGLDSLSIDNITGAAFYVPDSFEHTLAVSLLQQSWQKHLSANVNVIPLSGEELEQRFLSREYDIMMVPISSETPFVADFLASFKTGARNNRFGYRNELYDSIVSEIPRAETIEQAVAECARAESMLLHDAVVIPVYFDTSVFAAIPGLKGINATPYASGLNFKYIEK